MREGERRPTDELLVAGEVGEDVLRDGGEDLVEHRDGLLFVLREDLRKEVETLRQRGVRLQLREERAEPRHEGQAEEQRSAAPTCPRGGAAPGGGSAGPSVR